LVYFVSHIVPVLTRPPETELLIDGLKVERTGITAPESADE
jgi:hypothetical protein